MMAAFDFVAHALVVPRPVGGVASAATISSSVIMSRTVSWWRRQDSAPPVRRSTRFQLL
jgi:hypothetical protein